VNRAAQDVPAASQLQAALHAMFSTGTHGYLAGPIVSLAIAWLTHQTGSVRTVIDDGGDHPRLRVTFSHNWVTPHISFSVLVWLLCQVQSHLLVVVPSAVFQLHC